MFDVILTEVGRNLNRCVRTSYSFGLEKLFLHNCTGKIEGNLYSAKGIKIETITELPKNCIGFEKNKGQNISDIDWSKVNAIIIGGEQSNIGENQAKEIYTIPVQNDLCLTTEAALSIVLHEAYNVRFYKIKNARYVTPRIIASGLPTKSDVLYLQKVHGIDCVIDLSDRERRAVISGCEETGIKYVKFPIDEFSPDAMMFSTAVETIGEYKKVLVHCYKGIHRTGVLLHMMNVSEIEKKQFHSHEKLLSLCFGQKKKSTF